MLGFFIYTKIMGRATQFFDYLTRQPQDFTLDFVKAHYTHLEITPAIKKIRRKLKLWKGNVPET